MGKLKCYFVSPEWGKKNQNTTKKSPHENNTVKNIKNQPNKTWKRHNALLHIFFFPVDKVGWKVDIERLH